ncbi:hypothetical protein KSS87_021444, partial [Heliosperma pusillum]
KKSTQHPPSYLLLYLVTYPTIQHPQLSIQLQYTLSHSPSLNLPNTLRPLSSISNFV